MPKASNRASKKRAQPSEYGDLAMSVPASTASGRSKKVKGVVSGLRVERARNGFTLHKDLEGPHGEYMSGSRKPEVFTDAASLMQAVTKALA